MEDNEMLMSEDVENEEELTSEENVQEEVEETTVDETSDTGVENEAEEQPQGKFYTDEEFNQKVNEIADRRVARKMRKMERELDKYRDTENVLKSQLGGETIDEVNSKLRKLYADEGVNLPDRYVSEDQNYIEFLAQEEADDIIEQGYDTMLREANELASKGYENLSSKDKKIFMKLDAAISKSNDKKILAGLNVDDSILDDKSFIQFREQFNRNVPVSNVYEMYMTKLPKKEIKTPGSLKSNSASETIKDFYTEEEARTFTEKDFRRNPKLVEAIEKSMAKW